MPDQKPTLDYATTQPKTLRAAINGFFVGLIAAPPFLLLALVSGGGGHGHYGFARAAFPIVILATLMTGNEVTPALLAVTLLQIPAYGIIVGLSLSNRKLLWVAVVLAVLHCVAAIFCFSGAVPNFS